MSTILNGNQVRDQIKEECRPRVAQMQAKAGRAPGLAVVLVGDNSASAVYVRNKTKTAEELGLHHETIIRDASLTTEGLLEIIAELNERPDIDGILIQLPLPAQIDAQKALLAVAPEKDVDGFHPYNAGLLSTGRPGLRPCTPSGVIEILKRYQIPMAGKNAVVVGRSDIVGKPMAMLLLQENATVTIAHSRTADLPAVCRGAEILVAAIGRAAMITEEYIRPGAVVIDVGMNTVRTWAEAERIFDAARLEVFDKRGSLLVGDVHPGDMARVTSAYTGARRRGAADDCDADAEYDRSGRAQMLIAGLTGGLACGKSLVAKEFRELGAHVIEADELGHQAIGPGGEARAAVLEAFGTAERPELATAVFGNPAQLARLNAIVHPAVRSRARRLIEEIARRDSHAVVIYVAAILIESDGMEGMAKTIVVSCTREQQIARAMERPGESEERVLARLAHQMPMAEKLAKADYVIDTTGTKEDTLRQTKLVFEELRNLAA